MPSDPRLSAHREKDESPGGLQHVDAKTSGGGHRLSAGLGPKHRAKDFDSRIRRLSLLNSSGEDTGKKEILSGHSQVKKVAEYVETYLTQPIAKFFNFIELCSRRGCLKTELPGLPGVPQQGEERDGSDDGLNRNPVYVQISCPKPIALR